MATVENLHSKCRTQWIKMRKSISFAALTPANDLWSTSVFKRTNKQSTTKMNLLASKPVRDDFAQFTFPQNNLLDKHAWSNEHCINNKWENIKWVLLCPRNPNGNGINLPYSVVHTVLSSSIRIKMVLVVFCSTWLASVLSIVCAFVHSIVVFLAYDLMKIQPLEIGTIVCVFHLFFLPSEKYNLSRRASNS